MTTLEFKRQLVGDGEMIRGRPSGVWQTVGGRGRKVKQVPVEWGHVTHRQVAEQQVIRVDWVLQQDVWLIPSPSVRQFDHRGARNMHGEPFPAGRGKQCLHILKACRCEALETVVV
eukprot:Lithocolla_globosa_v1_NODE_4867_length_1349_cov_51.599691.p2 type:complete len:116 gc:universal NODE_4867_length_1349_cov_51.599691:1125-778(-)